MGREEQQDKSKGKCKGEKKKLEMKVNSFSWGTDNGSRSEVDQVAEVDAEQEGAKQRERKRILE